MGRRWWTLALGFALLLGMAGPVRAEHASINLTVTRINPEPGAAREDATASSDQEPPPGGAQPRPLFKARAGEPLVFQFYLTNTYPHGEIKGVTVRYFVVREEKPRQKTLPTLGKGVVTRGRFLMNFKPKCMVGARVQFTIDDPGVYLLRVQTEDTQSDHEHFGAIDIEVK